MRVKLNVKLPQERELMTVKVVQGVRDIQFQFGVNHVAARAICMLYGFKMGNNWYIDKDKLDEIHKKGIVDDIGKRWKHYPEHYLKILSEIESELKSCKEMRENENDKTNNIRLPSQ